MASSSARPTSPASYGHAGTWTGPEIQQVLKDAATRLAAIGKPAGMLTPNPEDAPRCIDWGYRFVAVGTNVGLLHSSADELARSFKD